MGLCKFKNKKIKVVYESLAEFPATVYVGYSNELDITLPAIVSSPQPTTLSLPNGKVSVVGGLRVIG